MVKLLNDEMVLRPEITEMYGRNALLNFNRTGDAGALGGNSQKQEPVNVTVIVKEPGPRTTVELAKSIYPHIKYDQQNYEAKKSPYSV